MAPSSLPVGIRRLLALGVGLTLLGLLGLGFTVGNDDAAGVVRWVFIPLYAVGALCLVAGGLWWALRWTRRRDG